MLDYEECTTAELCKFFEERSGTTLSEVQLQQIEDHGSFALIHRLLDMDMEMTFPRFMELPPELRLGVYEALVVPEPRLNVNKALPVEDEPLKHDVTPSSIHPAILQTSKRIHSEALAVLYKRNTFRAEIKYCAVESPIPRSYRTPVSLVVGCSLTIPRPGHEFAFHQHIPRARGRGSLLRRLLRDPTMGMLHALTHFTIDLAFVAPEKRELEDYVEHAYDAMASLCLAFTGRSKLQELTIKVHVGKSQVTDMNLAFVLWPLLFLRTDVVVKIEGANVVPGVELEYLVGVSMTPAEERSFGRQIAHARRVCSAEIEKGEWRDGYRPYDHSWDGVREVERARDGVSNYCIWLIRLDDVLNQSDVWKRIRGEADRVEVEEERRSSGGLKQRTGKFGWA